MSERQCHAIDILAPGRLYSFDTRAERSQWLAEGKGTRLAKSSDQIHREKLAPMEPKAEAATDHRGLFVERTAARFGMTVDEFDEAYSVHRCDCRMIGCQGFRIARTVAA